MFKKLIFPAFLLWIFSFWLSHADFKENDNGRNIAEKYLESNKNDDFWKDNSPRLWESTPLYMEKESPSYIEYAVICERNIDCWYIIVNIDGDDVSVPTSSPTDIPPTKILTQKSWVNKEDLQFFYFGIFDIYSQNRMTHQINAIDPQVDPITRKDFPEDMKEEEKEQIKKWIQSQKQKVPGIFQKQLNFWKDYKQTSDFQKAKEFIYSSDMVTPSIPGGSTWRYVPWESAWNCNSRVPCYEQYPYWYNGSYCDSWCSPVAAAIIFGYHDRHNITGLLPWKMAPMTNSWYYPFESDPTPKSMINAIRTHMETFCDGSVWLTYNYKNVYAKKYAIDMWYTSAWSWQASTVIQIPMRVPLEIDIWYPVLISIEKLDWTKGHSIVWYGYNVLNTNEVRINAGWWNGYNSNTNISLFNITNIQYDSTDTSIKTTERVTRYRF